MLHHFHPGLLRCSHLQKNPFETFPHVSLCVLVVVSATGMGVCVPCLAVSPSQCHLFTAVFLLGRTMSQGAGRERLSWRMLEALFNPSCCSLWPDLLGQDTAGTSSRGQSWSGGVTGPWGEGPGLGMAQGQGRAGVPQVLWAVPQRDRPLLRAHGMGSCDGVIVVSLRCHCSVTAASLWCHHHVTMVSLWCP